MRRLLLLPLAIALLLTVRSAAAEEQPRDLRSELSALVKKGDDDALLRAADEILARAPRSLVALEFRAYALQRQGRLRDARLTYESLLGLAPDHVWARTRLGTLLADDRRWDAAAEQLRHAVEVDPRAADAQKELIAVLRGGGDVPSAREAAAAARSADPSWGWAWRSEAELAWSLGDVDAAWDAMEQAERLGADDTVRLREVIDMDRRLLHAADEPEILTERWRSRHVWTFGVRDVSVRSSVGSRLRGDLVRMVSELPGRFRSIVGDDTRTDPRVVLRISRTLDEHERLRRVLFPQGSAGRAFTTTTGGGRDGSREVHVYLCWLSDDVETALAHELAHAAVRSAARRVPAWLDEGTATYLEKLRYEDDAVEPERPDLGELLRAALADDRVFTWPRMLAAQGADFAGRDARLRYAQAWSMVRFLLHHPAAGADDTVRQGRFVRLVRTGNRRWDGPGRGGWADWKTALETIYETPLEALETTWRDAL